MMAPTAIPAKIRRILPLLDSRSDGEALSACRAGGRILRQAGLTYVDLANAIPAGNLVDKVHEVRRGDFVDNINEVRTPPRWDSSGWKSAYRSNRRPSTFTPAQSSEHHRMARWVRDNDRGRLSPREREFIADISHQRRELTIPQADWLAILTDRLAMENRAA